MTVKSCPHCNHEIPPEFEIMPICSICGGNIHTEATQVWSSVDIQNKQNYHCPECKTSISSVLTTICPQCGIELQLAALPNEPPATSKPESPPSPLPPEAPKPEPKYPKEGLFSQLLRWLGLKK